MNRCEIPTKIPENPACINASVITHVIRDEIDAAGICLHERGCDAVCVVNTELTTRQVVALLEAHKEVQEEQGRIWALALMDRVAASGEPTGREAILIAGLRRIADPDDRLDMEESNSSSAAADFAVCLLRNAGVDDAEPEKGAGHDS